MAYPARSACLARLPVEILLEIHHHLDIDSIFELCLANKSFFSFFEQRKATILLPALEREFSPLGELLQVYTASGDDINVSGGLCKPRRMVLRRFAGDQGLVLADPSPSGPMASERSNDDGFVPVAKGRKPNPMAEAGSNTVVLSEKYLGPLRKCQLVRKWEGLFPQMRWFHRPENCRFLRPYEQVRFRRALYRWWFYGIYFHGELPRPRVGHPEPHVDDIRTSQMRYHSTSELLELMDLLETIKDVIMHYICPRLDPDEQQSPDQRHLIAAGRSRSLATSWNDQSCWGRVVKTYAKLGPDELLYYFDNIYCYSRKRLICKARREHPSFTFDQESIQIAIRCALDERQWLDKRPSLPDEGGGGIIDFGDESDSERLALGGTQAQTDRCPLDRERCSRTHGTRLAVTMDPIWRATGDCWNLSRLVLI